MTTLSKNNIASNYINLKLTELYSVIKGDSIIFYAAINR